MNLNRDRAALENVVLKGCSAECTLCGKTKPLSEFGLRKMGNGEIRNQAQCKECR